MKGAAKMSGRIRSIINQISGPIDQPWPIIVINLDRSAVRMRETSHNLADNNLSCVRFAAVDGEAMSPSLVAQLTTGHGFKRALTRAEVGCFASHLLVWHCIAQAGCPRVIVLEDDARLISDARARLEALARDKGAWDILKLCYPVRNLSQESAIVTFANRIPVGTTGYAITSNAAAWLVATMVPFGKPVDIALKTWWEHGLSVGVAVPPIGAPAKTHKATSTIAAGREQASREALTVRFLRNIRYQLGRRIDRVSHFDAARSAKHEPGTLHPAMIRLIEEAE